MPLSWPLARECRVFFKPLFFDPYQLAFPGCHLHQIYCTIYEAKNKNKETKQNKSGAVREAPTCMEDTRDLKEEREQATSRREVFQAKGTVKCESLS